MATSSAELAVQFGFEEAFFRADPELWNLFQQARKGQWTPTKFQAAFMNTNWYRSRQASIRQWTDLSTRDPAEAQAKIRERKASLEDQVSQLGITMDDASLNSLATQSMQYAWSDAQLNNVLASYVHYTPGQTGGTVAGLESEIRNMAYSQGVDVSDSQMQDWITGVVSQKYTKDSLTDFVKDMALSKYGGMQNWLNTGMTVRQVAAPYLQEFGRLMEVDPNTVDLNDPLLASALQGKIDPKSGQPQMMTVSQMQRAVKSDPRWMYTDNARQDMTNLGQGILKDMGLYS